MSRKYYVISMDSSWSPYRPCIGCPNSVNDEDGEICRGGTDCPLMTAKKVKGAYVLRKRESFEHNFDEPRIIYIMEGT